ncbi:hypothetical protein BK809_0000049 [Diplodia seriata]|uniref:Nucleoside phosphorylase domain-containing protein n=1 Tax=Diplodia seriata TaxID=420778 RepID=A0A1S8BAU5_9PEZI|nr:hypothetical protein BK809_0000049 [Diplodia seriata]
MALPNGQYTVGWICALQTEGVAALQFLDDKHGVPNKVDKNDDNNYTLGRMGKHNVVIAILPRGEYGTSSATSVARDMLHSFPNIRIGLMVGIGGGAPSTQNDIRLGDVVVSTPKGTSGGVFQYDYGKTIQEKRFQHSGHLNQTPKILLTAVHGLGVQFESEGNGISEAIGKALEKNKRLRKRYGQPDPASDRLYKPDVVHPDAPGQPSETCMSVCGDDPRSLVQRQERTEEDDNPMVFHGIIASGNSLMKDASIRDTLSRENGVLCFEMEAAGLMNNFPCLVVRGICDYSDTHKNDAWHGYAAMSAAAYTKALLLNIPPDRLEAQQKLAESIKSS